MIGFAPEAGFTPDAGVYGKCRWYLYLFDGFLYSQESISRKQYKEGGIATGSIVTCSLDASTRAISYKVNGTPCGIAYRNIPQGEGYAALCFLGKDNRLTLVG